MRRSNQYHKCIRTLRPVAVLSILIILAATTTALAAGGLSTARSVAMGGAYIGLACGYDAAKYNPANLGFMEYRTTGIELAGVGTSISNNSFTLNDYNTYTGAYLTSKDKQDILGKIPSEGLKLAIDAEATALGFSTGPWALTTTGTASAAINLNKDIVDLILNGNTVADTLSIQGSYSDAVGYASVGFSYGSQVAQWGSKRLSVGATARYIKGLGIERIIELEGLATTHDLGFAGQGEVIAQTATGGKGYALDLGAALRIGNHHTIGLSIRNFLSSITWNKDTEEHGYIFQFDSMTVDNSDDDEIINSTEYTEDIPSFKTTLPSEMTLGFAKTSGNFIWAIDYIQGFRKEAAGASTKPRMALGIEWSPISFMPFRAGLSTGGNRNSAFSFGSGFEISAFYLDFAAVIGSSFSGYSSKGADLAISTGLNF